MRSQYWDEYKGLAAIAVIAIHACGETGKFPTSSLNWHFGLIFRQIIDFAVPIFFAMSGYFSLPHKNDSGDINWFEYYNRRLVRILIPYIIWTVIFVIRYHRSHIASPVDLTKDFLFGTGIGIGYYVVVLLQFLFLVPVIMKIKSKSMNIVVMITISSLGLIYSYYTRINFPNSMIAQFPFNGLLFFVWYPFFHLGIYAKRFGFGAENRIYVYGIITALFVAMMEAEKLASLGLYSFGTSQIKISSYLVSIFIFVAIVTRSSRCTSLRMNQSSISKFGKHSYVIYLSHLLFLGTIQRLLQKSTYIYNMQFLYIALSILLTAGFCAALLIAIDKMVPQKMHVHLGM